jgi:hypothetical protein
MANYCVQVFDGPYAEDRAFPTLDAAKAHRDWLRANDVPDYNIRIVCTDLDCPRSAFAFKGPASNS